MITARSINIILKKKAEFFSSIIGGKIALHGSQEWKLKILGPNSFYKTENKSVTGKGFFDDCVLRINYAFKWAGF